MGAELEGKAVLITGASSGLGFAAAEAFAREGCDVALLARGREGLEKAARRVEAPGRKAVIVAADVTDRDAVQAAIDDTVTELGALDVLVLCAAGTVFGPFLEVEPEDFDRVTDVTYTGSVNCVRAALPELERTAGSIVATGSLMSQVPLPTFSSYAAAKHAERGFLNSLRVELKASRSAVEVCQLHPGAINTPVWDNTLSATGFLPRRPPENYSPHEVAGALVQLARDPRAEMMFGGEAHAIRWLFDNVRPAGDLLLSVVHHYYLSGKRPAVSDVNALWSSVGKGIAANGSFQRPSLTRLATAPWRALVRS